MTRNKYCHVCGTELQRGRIRKEKPEQLAKKKPFRNFFRKKATIRILTLTILVGIAVPAVVTPIAHRVQYHREYNGTLVIYSAIIIPDDQDHDSLEVVFGVESGKVSVEEILFYSLTKDWHYGTYHRTYELERYELKVQTFSVDKYNVPPLTDGFSLLIINKYTQQWISYRF